MRLALVLLLVACASSSGPTGPNYVSTVPRFGHVFIVMEENHGFSGVVGNTAMPYLNGLIQQFALATRYYANTHPSIGNYFMLTAGKLITNKDRFTDTVTDDNIVRELLAAGKTWKAYAEDLPSVGYVGDSAGLYVRRHNPLSYLSDVVNDPVQRQNLVPFTEFATDLAASTLPTYSFIVPNLCDDAHNCPRDAADDWLKTNIDPLLTSTTFLQDGLLIITFDEASVSDTTHGGGRVAWVVVSAKSKRGYESALFYQHQSTLRLMMKALGLTTFPNDAATAPDMGDLFATP